MRGILESGDGAPVTRTGGERPSCGQRVHESATMRRMAERPRDADEILWYYGEGHEAGRLLGGVGRLEFQRTQDIVRRQFLGPQRASSTSGVEQESMLGGLQMRAMTLSSSTPCRCMSRLLSRRRQDRATRPSSPWKVTPASSGSRTKAWTRPSYSGHLAQPRTCSLVSRSTRVSSGQPTSALPRLRSNLGPWRDRDHHGLAGSAHGRPFLPSHTVCCHDDRPRPPRR
jgi:hypothetical protein